MVKEDKKKIHFQIMKIFLGSGPFSMGRLSQGKQKILFIFGLNFFQSEGSRLIPEHVFLS